MLYSKLTDRWTVRPCILSVTNYIIVVCLRTVNVPECFWIIFFALLLKLDFLKVFSLRWSTQCGTLMWPSVKPCRQGMWLCCHLPGRTSKVLTRKSEKKHWLHTHNQSYPAASCKKKKNMTEVSGKHCLSWSCTCSGFLTYIQSQTWLCSVL